MNKTKFTAILITLFLMVFSGALFAQGHTIVSEGEISSFQDSSIPAIWNNPDGSLILSWDQGVTGLGGGFMDLTVFTPFPNGGKYELSLISVISSNANKITGFFGIKKNSGTQEITMGTATGLNGAVGSTVTINAGAITVNALISFRFDGLQAPQEVSGQILVNDDPLFGAKVKLKDDDLTTITTDVNGKYLFIGVDPADFKKVVMVFKNFLNSLVISGTVYVGGVPLSNASVSIQNPNAVVLATTTTDANGVFTSPTITNAAGGTNIRVIVKK